MIRPAEPRDHAAVAELATLAFGQRDEAEIIERLRADRAMVLELVWAEDDDPLGHAAFSAMRAPSGTVGLAPLAVRPDRQRRGIGSALVRDGIARLRGTDAAAIFVLGDPAFYRRFGFSLAGAAAFQSRYPAEHLMALDLGGLGALSGRLKYADAIEEA